MGVVNRGHLGDQAGMPPVPYDGHVKLTDQVADRSTQTFVRPGRNSEGRRTSANRSASGFNLRGVCEVLTDFGLDPVAEIATVLQQRKQKLVVNAEGQRVPAKDKDGNELTEPALDIDLRTKVLMELTNFVHPKLKATEMTIKKPELSDQQIEERLVALLQRATQKSLT